jgi:hypothetical protein
MRSATTGVAQKEIHKRDAMPATMTRKKVHPEDFELFTLIIITEAGITG